MMLRPLIRPIVRPLVRGVTEPGYGSLAAQIRLLFASGEQGAWYDPSDLSTLYQDYNGTTPVTALGQPVGLMLDKSKGLVRGPELVANGGFDSDSLAGWGTSQSTLSVVAGELAVTTTTNSWGQAHYTITGAVVGKTYELKAYCRKGTAEANAYVALWDGETQKTVIADSTGAGASLRYIFTVKAGSTPILKLTANATTSGKVSYFDNCSVRELPGNHASQPTATARPTLQAGNKIDFDGVDDKLTTTFPDLGTAVTIVRSVPGTGASILTGQTIGAGARDDSTDHHGLLIINRALTAPETALVTRWANMRAGV